MMNLYQAGYTRRGRQGMGSGWSIVAPSKGMSQDAKDGFSGIAGNLVELANGGIMPGEAFGLFRHGRFFYYMHINYEAGGVQMGDARGVSFTHAYCFNINDCYCLCRNPERLLGLTGKTFLDRYDSGVSEYPVVHEIPYSAMDFGKIKQTYRLDPESYRRLLIGATCALEGCGDSLCIKLEKPMQDYGRVCREIMFLIMSGIPYQLRPKLTFFSYRGGKTNIYFSDRLEGNNYFDLETKEYRCEKRGLERYQFTKIYNLSEESNMREILRAMADFFDQSLEVPLKDVNCDLIEHSFQSQLKKVWGKDIDKDLAVGLLDSFMGYPLKDSVEADAYIAELMAVIDRNDMALKDSRLIGRLLNRAWHSADMALHTLTLDFGARQIIALDKQEGYGLLWEQYLTDMERYAELLYVMEEKDEGYYGEYLNSFFLKRCLENLGDFRPFLEKFGDVACGEKFRELLEAVTIRELKTAKGFDELFEVHSEADRIAGMIERADGGYGEWYRVCSDYLLWDAFDFSLFSLQDMNRYIQCSLNRLAQYGFNGKPCNKAVAIKRLILIMKGGNTEYDADQLCEMFYTDVNTICMSLIDQEKY